MNQQYLIPPQSDGQPVKEEKTFRRDMKLLLRHRDWGWNVPAEDIDFLEYDERKAIALFEYKRTTDLATCKVNIGEANIQALIDLANKASVPIFCTFYNPNLKWYRVFPLNEQAQKKGPPQGIIAESKYVDFLYWLRGRQIPEGIRHKLW